MHRFAAATLLFCVCSACTGASTGVLEDSADSDSGAVGGDDTATADTGEPARPAPYPIVLCHGFGGFSDLGNVGLVDYFFGVRDALQGDGELLVFTPEVDPFNDSERRGAQLVARVEEILEETGHDKVNLIGHSQGGLDARYVASTRPELVASVTTVSTPHNGTILSDIALGLEPHPLAQDVVDWLINQIGGPLYDEVGDETSFFASVWQYSQPGITEFNDAHPDQARVAYYSLAGRTDWNLGGIHCETASEPGFVSAWSHERDPVDAIFAVPELILDGGLGDPEANDGLLRVSAAKRGVFFGCVPADHLDEIGQIAGDSPGLGNDWDHREFYVDVVAWLRAQGH